MFQPKPIHLIYKIINHLPMETEQLLTVDGQETLYIGVCWALVDIPELHLGPYDRK